MECGNKADSTRRRYEQVAGGGVGRGGMGWDGMGQPLRGEWEQLTELTAKLADQGTKVNFHPPYHQLDICIVFTVGLDGMNSRLLSASSALWLFLARVYSSLTSHNISSSDALLFFSSLTTGVLLL